MGIFGITNHLSPNGVLTTFFPTGHALGITSNSGAEILIHVGMDTVQLEGKHFTPKAKQGDTVKAGDILLEFDVDAIKAEGYSLITPVIVTNPDQYLDIIETDKKVINYQRRFINNDDIKIKILGISINLTYA